MTMSRASGHGDGDDDVDDDDGERMLYFEIFRMGLLLRVWV